MSLNQNATEFFSAYCSGTFFIHNTDINRIIKKGSFPSMPTDLYTEYSPAISTYTKNKLFVATHNKSIIHIKKPEENSFVIFKKFPWRVKLMCINNEITQLATAQSYRMITIWGLLTNELISRFQHSANITYMKFIKDNVLVFRMIPTRYFSMINLLRKIRALYSAKKILLYLIYALIPITRTSLLRAIQIPLIFGM